MRWETRREACCVLREATAASRATGQVSGVSYHAPRAPHRHAPRRAFTLIELMVVIAIMGIVMTMSAPAIYHIWKKESLRKSVQDLLEACANARKLAILRGSQAELIFHAQDGTFEVHGPAAPHHDDDSAPPAEVSAPVPSSGMGGKLPESVAIAALKINGVNYMDADDAMVRFYPNGTCDELRLVLLQPADGDVRGIFLEITTGLASVETDRFKLASEVK